MTKSASSYWQQLMKNIPSGEFEQLKTKAKKRIFQRSNPASILWLLTIIAAMLFWNPKLLFSCGMGVFVMLFVYSTPQWNWQKFWGQIHNYLQTPSGRLVLSVTSGTVACLGTYTAATIWVNVPNIWISAGAIAQGIATVIILILLARRELNSYGDRQQLELEKLSENLVDTDPLKRLIGVRQLTKLATSEQLELDTKEYIIECLRLLLKTESETAIRDAAFKSLQTLEPAQKLIPLSVKVKNRVSC